jgi:hypothetical protein
MGPAAIGTAIGTATLTVGRGALSAVGNGLSFLGQLANATSGAASQSTGDAPHSTRLSIQQRCIELKQRIQRQLALFGVQLSKPVELMSDQQGGVVVAGSHPQQRQVEAALGSDILLERDFNQLAGEYRNFIDESGAADFPPNLVIAVPGAG